jgi:hypothetical protein
METAAMAAAVLVAAAACPIRWSAAAPRAAPVRVAERARPLRVVCPRVAAPAQADLAQVESVPTDRKAAELAAIWSRAALVEQETARRREALVEWGPVGSVPMARPE